MPEPEQKKPQSVAPDVAMQQAVQSAMPRAGGNAEREQEEMQAQMERIDQYALTGAMNYPMALAIALDHFKRLNRSAQEDIVLIVVTRLGAVQIFGSGEAFPTNEEVPAEAGFIVTIDDIEEELDAEKKEGK